MTADRATLEQHGLETARLRLELGRLRALHELAIELSASSTAADVWRCIGEKLLELTDAMAVAVTSYTPQARQLVIEHLAVREQDRQLPGQIEATLGFPVVGMQIPVSNAMLAQILAERVRTADDFHDSTFGMIPAEVARTVSANFGLGPFCNLALVDGADLLGTVVIVMPQGAEPLSADARVAIGHVCLVAVRRARDEGALRQAHDRYQALLAAIPDIVVEVDRDKAYTWANEQGVEFFGRDVVGKPAAHYFDGAQDTYERVAPLFDGRADLVCLESWQRRCDGERRLLAWRCRALRDRRGRVTGALSSARDVTDERCAFDEANAFLDATRAVLEGRTFESTARNVFACCRKLIGAPAGLVGLLDTDRSQLDVVVLGTGAPGLPGPQPASIPCGGLLAEACQGQRAVFDNNFAASPDRQLLPGDHARLDNVLFAPLRVDGQTVGLLAFANKPGRFEQRDAGLAETFGELIAVALRDRRKDDALRRSEEQFRLVFEKVADGIVLTDPQTTKFAMANAAMCTMLGYAAEEMGGLGISDIHPAGAAPGQTGEFQKLLAGEQSLAPTIAVRRKDGSTFQAHISGTQVEIGGRRLLLACFRDVTERQRLQASVAQADRLASVGMLAAGVAHEINNPLAYVLYNLDDLAAELPLLSATLHRCAEALVGKPYGAPVAADPESLRALFDPTACDALSARAREAQEGGLRIKEIVRGLRTFSRVERTEREPVNIEQSLEHAVNMAHNEIRYRARLVKDYGQVPSVLASEGKLAQVFLNLLINAAHAIDEGNVAHNEIRVRTWAEGDRVCAEVADTGAGIPAENLGRIFDPFFTTKAVGAGSGLGLTICRNIVSELGGDISVESQVGTGTRVVVRLPLGRAPVAASADALAGRTLVDARPSAPVERGRILVIDDESAIRSVLKRLLGRDHEVVTAESGEQGQAILGTDQGFDLIICDLMMPKMSGMEMHEWLVAHHPALARSVIFVTGGVFTPRARDYLERVENLTIEKPFDGIALRRTVAERVAAGRAHSRQGAPAAAT